MQAVRGGQGRGGRPRMGGRRAMAPGAVHRQRTRGRAALGGRRAAARSGRRPPAALPLYGPARPRVLRVHLLLAVVGCWLAGCLPWRRPELSHMLFASLRSPCKQHAFSVPFHSCGAMCWVLPCMGSSCVSVHMHDAAAQADTAPQRRLTRIGIRTGTGRWRGSARWCLQVLQAPWSPAASAACCLKMPPLLPPPRRMVCRCQCLGLRNSLPLLYSSLSKATAWRRASVRVGGWPPPACSTAVSVISITQLT